MIGPISLTKQEPMKVLVEIKVPNEQDARSVLQFSAAFDASGFEMDADYEPVPMSASQELAADLEAAQESIVMVRGSIDENKLEDLKAQDKVVAVWLDTPIAPFDDTDTDLGMGTP